MIDVSLKTLITKLERKNENTTTSKIFVLRVNDANNQSRDGFQYPVSGAVSAPDWNPKPVCGGGLHGWEHGIGDVTAAKERIEIVQGDITAQDEWFDVIANAANESLLGGGGVDGAIHKTAGPDLLKFCQGLGGCAVGSAKLSPGFKLRARHIAHAVGPRWQGGCTGESEALASVYQSIMELAIEQRATRIALPSISTGAFGFPLE